MGLDDFFQQLGQKYFTPAVWQAGLRMFQKGKTIISFKRGDPENYFIVSGIINEAECKVIFKKDHPLRSSCSCAHWRPEHHCPHVAALFFHFHYRYQLAQAAQGENPSSHLPPILRTLAVYPESYGTIIKGPEYLINAGPHTSYASLQYLLDNQNLASFPVPRPWQGKLIVALPKAELLLAQNEEFNSPLGNPLAGHPPPAWRFLYQDAAGQLHNHISLLENLYLFDWHEGQAYHLPAILRQFVSYYVGQGPLSIHQILPSVCTWIGQGVGDALLGEQFLGQYPTLTATPEIHLRPRGKQQKQMELAVYFHTTEEVAPSATTGNSTTISQIVAPPQRWIDLSFARNGQLGLFKTKRQALEFVQAYLTAWEGGYKDFTKFLINYPRREYWEQDFKLLQASSQDWSADFAAQKAYLYPHNLQIQVLNALLHCFTPAVLRWASWDEERRAMIYTVPAPKLWAALAEFYAAITKAGVKIYYQDKVVQPWHSTISLQRRHQNTDWFEMQVEMSELDQEILQAPAGPLILTRQGLVHLTDEQQQLQRFMQKYFGPGKNHAALAPGKGLTIRMSKARIFELFELKKLGLNDLLTPEEHAICDHLLHLEKLPTYPIDPNLAQLLRPYQQIGHHWLCFLYEHRLGACLADDMGLGKTVQAISFLQYVYPKVKRILIVCPLTLLLNWSKEFKKFSSLTPYIYHGGERSLPPEEKIILTSYGVIKKDAAVALKDELFDILIMDEVQHLKNLHTLGAKAARMLQANFRICLTGTPVENNLAEFFNILDLSLPGLWGDLKLMQQTVQQDLRFAARQTASPFILRRTKAQVLQELPPKQENIVYLEFSPSERLHYQRQLQRIRNQLAIAKGKMKYSTILQGLLKLRQCCLWQKGTSILSRKIDFLLETITSILGSGHQAIIFSQFTTYLDIIQNAFKAHNYNFSRIDGTQSIKKRQQQVDLFQEGKNPLFLISLKAGGVGLNLTAASYVFIMDPWWNPAVENQAIDRAHRIGQKNTLTVYRPVIKDTVEEKILDLQNLKRQLFQDLFPDQDEQYFMGRLTMKDFELFFK